MLRLTARYADAWNTAWYGRPDARLRQRLSALEAALDAEGRDPATLRKTVGVEVQQDELGRALAEYVELGFDDVIVLLQPMTEESLDRLAEAAARAEA